MERNQGSNDVRAALEATYEPLARRVIESFGLAGVAVGVVKDGALVYAHGFGVRSLATGEPVTPRSLFHLASVSKPFVATAVVQLVEQGRVALDAPVVTYLPYFRLHDPRYAAITVRHLLTHTGGMPDAEDYRWYAPEDDDAALERYVRSLADVELIAAPGERYRYSNAAFEVLGDVIAKASGQTFEGYVKAHILDPLGMCDSTFLRRAVAPGLATTPHLGLPLTVLAGAYPYHRAHAPSSTLHSSIEELGRWAIANLRRGSVGGRQLVSPAGHDLLWHPAVRIGKGGRQEAVGLSWFCGTYRGRRVISHGGSDPGFGADLVFLPDEDAAVIVLVNANTASFAGLTDPALDLLLGDTPAVPQPPITLPVAAALAAEGPAAAVALYRRLRATEPDRFDARPARFLEATWGAIEVHRAEAVLPLVQLWVALQPDCSEAHWMLGWARMVRGERDLAAAHLRHALALDPDNEQAALHLQQLDRRAPAG